MLLRLGADRAATVDLQHDRSCTKDQSSFQSSLETRRLFLQGTTKCAALSSTPSNARWGPTTIHCVGMRPLLMRVICPQYFHFLIQIFSVISRCSVSALNWAFITLSVQCTPRILHRQLFSKRSSLLSEFFKRLQDSLP